MHKNIYLPGWLTKLCRDERGSIIIKFTIMLPVIMGIIGLGLDGSRFLMLNNESQDLADAAALAGAKELDGAVDAITRADNAARTLLNNAPRWSDLGSGQVATVEFFEKLNPDVPTTDPVRASLIKVTSTTRQVMPTFLRAAGATSNNQTSATATAGSDIVACNVQPLMLCNPYEPVGQEFHATPGQLFWMKTKGSDSPGGDGNSFAPGDFGLLDPPGYNSSGANLIRDLLSKQSPKFCYVNNVSPRTGHATQKVNEGINVRFDMQPNGSTSGMDLTPAPDVIKGLIPNGDGCNFNGNPPEFPQARLPRDTNLTTIGNVKIGDGQMSAAAKTAYWQYHYGAGTDWPAGLTTRYQAYLRELGLDGQSAPTVTGPEPRAPHCAPVGAGTFKRRIISVAIVNCLANNVHGNSVTNVRSNAYADFFVTEPSIDGDVFAEFIEMITVSSGSGGKLHHIVQLYR
jgi:Flp pilus assembly protein TadG